MATSAEPTLAGDFAPATEQQWREAVDRVLRGGSFDRLVSRTADGIAVQPLYTDGPDEAVTGTPGAAPFTRGFSAAQRDGGMWDVRCVLEGADPAASSAQALRELERGATSLQVGGGALASDEALAASLEGVLLDLAPVVLRPGAAFLETARWLMELWIERGVGDADARGGFGADPLGTLAGTGELPQGVQRALADAAGLAAMATDRYPGVRALTVDATVWAEAGSSEAQELAAAACTTVAYLRAMQAAGVPAEAAGRQIELVLGADADFFTTIAKLRAARRVVSALCEACGIDPTVSAPTLTVRTLDRDLSRRDRWVNLLRVTSGTFAAVLGGADAVISTPFDAEWGEPTELGRRMARNTQLLLGEESGVGRVVDPAGGSWYVETLTEQIATAAWELFAGLEAAGGLPAVLVDGTLPARVAEVRDARLAAVATRRSPITGVSEFPDIDEELPEVSDTAFPVGPPSPPAGDHATRCTPLEPVRWSQAFEALRDAADAAPGGRPEVFLANLGPVAEHTARASFAKNLFEAGGIAAVTSSEGASTGFETADAAAEAFGASGARLVCICSSDDRYADVAAAVATALRDAGAARIYLAGKPGERGDEWTAAGVDEFVHVGVDVLAVLRGAHELLGIPASGGVN